MHVLRKYLLITPILGLLSMAAHAGTPNKHRAPDYSSATDWVTQANITAQPFDVFYIHPTTYGTTNMGMNQSLDDPAIRQATDATTISQVSVFKDRCNIFAPRYRQMSIHAIGMSDEEQKPYFDIALQDVRDAFEYYMKYLNNGRPFFLAAHSQGSYLAHGLYSQYPNLIPDKQIIAAYLIGWTFTTEDLDTFQLPLAVGPEQLGGLITWNTIGHGGQSPTLRPGAQCVNPLTWTASTSEAPASQNLCAVIELDNGSVTNIPFFTSARINEDGGLQIPTPTLVDDLNMSMGPEVYHRYDYDFFYSNLVQNVSQRCNAWIKKSFAPILGYDKIALPPFDPTQHIPRAPDYTQESDWLRRPKPSGSDRPPVDVFWVYPTVLSDDEHWIMDIDDAPLMQNAAWTLVTQASIFNGQADIYAPKYRQVNMEVLPRADLELHPVFQVGQDDVKRAFKYYMEHDNQGRPFILAGHSQGSYRSIEMAKEIWGKTGIPEQLVAAYTIGYSITPEDIKTHPHIRMCEHATDTGCFIAYNSVAPGFESSAPTIKPGTFTVNPLLWNTGSDPAPATNNIAAVFFNRSDPDHPERYPHFAAAQVKNSGLEVTDITHPEKVACKSKTFPTGVYHIDDYAIFYENLKKNVQARITAYAARTKEIK